MSHGATEKCGNNALTSEELNSKDVVLSLYDKDYNRTISDRVARSGNETSAPAIAKQLFDELKGGGSRFLARHTKVKAGKTFYKGIACYYSEIDDMGALKKILTSVKKRREKARKIASRRRKGNEPQHESTRIMPNRLTKCKNQNKLFYEEKIEMRPDNHLYVSHFEGTDRFKVHIHDPYSTRELLEFVGQHVATILFRECNWDIRVRQLYDKTYEFITFGKLEKRTSLDDAVEGEDKFTGYTALAKWSDKKGVYKKYVVDRNDPFLVNLGIKEMPYSLFRESKDPYQLPETSRNEREKRPNVPPEQLGAEGESIDDRKPKAFGASSKKRSRFNDDQIKSSNDLTQEVIDLCDDEIKQEPPDDSPFESGTIISGNSELKRTTTNDVVSSSLYTRGQICSMSSNTIQVASTDPLAHSGMDNFVAMNVEISQKLSIARKFEETDAIVLFGHIKEWSRLYSKCPENIKNFDCAKVLGFVKRYEENARFLDTANAEIEIADAEIHQNVIQAIIAECKSHLPIPLRC